jgi:hypothetical protein
VNRGRVVSFLGGLAVAAALVGASAASAATLIGDYQLQGTRDSSGPGAPLTDLGAGNVFQTETVMGVSRQVLGFPQDNGLRLNPTGITGSTYSVVMTFRFADVTDYARILDSTNAGSDGGFYVHDGMADYYDTTADPDHEGSIVSPNAYVTIAMTQQYPPAPALSSIYVNGSLAGRAGTAFPVLADTLRFFRDDSSTDEESAGAVSCIRVFNDVLSDSEVGAIGASATCKPSESQPTTQAPGTVTKKCKKHKKKHGAAAAKKKCKKKKRR